MLRQNPSSSPNSSNTAKRLQTTHDSDFFFSHAMYIGSVADHFAVPHLPRQQLVNCTRDADGFLDEDTCIVPFWHTRVGQP